MRNKFPPPPWKSFDALRWLGHVARMPRDKLHRRHLTAWVYMPKGIKTEFKLGMRRLDYPARLRVPAQQPQPPPAGSVQRSQLKPSSGAWRVDVGHTRKTLKSLKYYRTGSIRSIRSIWALSGRRLLKGRTSTYLQLSVATLKQKRCRPYVMF